MLVPGELGFYFVIFFLFIVFPVILLVIRRKWQLELARRDEISRLLVLAAEEAARAEFEASFSYCVAPVKVSSPVVVVNQSVCAVCCTPTHNRCSRCKAVHYCSGKCQIIHWRQGHKDDCRPSPVGYGIDDEVSRFVTRNVNDGSSSDEQGEAPLEGSKGENAAVDTCLRGEEPGSIYVVRDSSVSFGASTLVPGQGTCIDTSTSDDDSLHGLDSESLDSSTTFDSFETASSDSHVEQIKPFEKKTHVRVDFDASISDSGGPKGEAFSEKTSSLGSGVNHSDKKSVDPSISASGFWDGTLDSSRTRKHVPSNKANPKPIGADYGKLPDLKSTKQYSADPSGGLSSSKHLHVSETLGNNLGTSRTAETTSSNKQSAARVIRQSSAFPSFKEPGTRIKGADENHIKSAEVGVSSATSRDVISPSSSSRANRLNRSDQDTQQSSVSQTAASSLQSNEFSSSGMKGNTSSVANSVKVVPNNGIPLRVSRPTPSASVGLKSSMLKVYDQFRVPRSSKQGDGVGKNGEKAIFAYELFVKLYHWNKVELRPCGLINCGNSCYANAVLQCLAFTPPITAYLLQGLHSKTCAKKEWCFTCEFEKLILKANELGYPQSPIGILSQIQKIGSHLTHGREEDAHEFLRYAIETMQSICLQEAGLKGCSSLEEETTLVGLTFGGYLRSKIKCTKCHVKSEKQERTMDLTVEIEGDIETLEDALQRFTGTECLDGENKYHCGRCNSYEKAKKKLSIMEAPNVLTVALKRFQSGKFGKLNKSIRFPEILNLAPYMRGGSDKAPIYRLYGVVVHLDIMNASFSGHYVCYVRNAQNKWFKIDDSTVKPVELDQVLNKGAYMLFYSRCSPRAPRSIRSTIVSRDLPIKIRNPASDQSRSNVKTSASRTRDLSTHANRIPDNLAHKDETNLNFNMYGFESSSDNASLFSHSDEISTSTDSTRDSISADDISQYIFGYNAFSRSSDLDTSSSSSSSSSSPLYTAHSPLSNSENVLLTDNGGGSFLHSNISKQDRNLVNISIREVDAKTLGSANPFDNGKSGVYLRRSTRK